jgi:hypothetical protein
VTSSPNRLLDARAVSPPLGSTPRGVVRLLAAAGITLALVGVGDVALFLWPLRLGDAEWEFGTVARLIDALPVPTMSALLIGLAAIGARDKGFGPRVLAIVLALGACALLFLLSLFLLDVPVAFRAVAVAAGPGRPTDPAIHSGLMRAVTKTFAFGGAYALGWGAMARVLWATSRRRY